MRRPDIELSDEAAAFVERHPEVIASLAGQSPTALEPDEVTALRASIRSRLRDRLTQMRGSDTQGAGRAFLARYGL
ncbi:MAG: hypothetical protein ABW022_11420 [Actinoplanes sp.]